MNTENKKVADDPDEKWQPAIELPNSPDDSERVLRLVNRFGGRREDDSPEEAAIRLASMALVLANIAAGHLRGGVDGNDLELGVDFVVEGDFAAGDFVSSVIGPVSWVQDRWERNLLHDVAPDAVKRGRMNALANEKNEQDILDGVLLTATKVRRHFADAQKKHLKLPNLGHCATGDPLGSDAPSSEGTAGAGQPTRKREVLMPMDVISIPLTCWRRATLCREAIEYPVVFSGTVAPAGLQNRASRAHLGHLLMHSRIDSSSALENLRKALTMFAERGTLGLADGSPPVRGDLALCGGGGLLDEAVAASPDRLRSVSGLLWLVESSPGCELHATMERIPDSSALDFRLACEKEIRRRINFTDGDVHPLDALNGRMAGWRSFLRERERHLPGIAATVGNLPLALCYGLEAMLNRKSGAMDGDELVALAKWLVIRMSNRIAIATAAGRDTRTERLAARLAEKLATYGPMKVRDLTRKCSRLSADECRATLGLLADRKIAAEQNGLWGIRGDSSVARVYVRPCGN
jgi:hypothetical protein